MRFGLTEKNMACLGEIMSAPFRGHTFLLRNEGNEHKQNIGETRQRQYFEVKNSLV